MRTRIAFVDDMQAAKDFATGDVVRRMGYREMLPGPFAGRVIYSNPHTGKVHVQWPWGDEEEPATELVRDLSGEVAVNGALDSLYSTWESSRLINDPITAKADKKWFEGLLKQDEKWRKQVASVGQARLLRLARIVLSYEERTRPVWITACKAWYDGLGEIAAFRRVAEVHARDFGFDAVRLTVSNLYGLAASPDPRLALYWKDGGRKYKVTKREKDSGSLSCPRCRNSLKPRIYRHQKKVLQCRGCGFTISPKDLIWDADPEVSPSVVMAPAEASQ